MDELAQSGRLQRYYTQNIDCFDARLSWLSQKTVQLHGRLDTLICQLCQDTKEVGLEEFERVVASSCYKCETTSEDQVRRGKGALGVSLFAENTPLWRRQSR